MRARVGLGKPAGQHGGKVGAARTEAGDADVCHGDGQRLGRDKGDVDRGGVVGLASALGVVRVGLVWLMVAGALGRSAERVAVACVGARTVGCVHGVCVCVEADCFDLSFFFFSVLYGCWSLLAWCSFFSCAAPVRATPVRIAHNFNRPTADSLFFVFAQPQFFWFLSGPEKKNKNSNAGRLGEVGSRRQSFPLLGRVCMCPPTRFPPPR